MAKQKGIVPIEGTLGNMTFYKSEDGYLVREKGGIPKSRILADPKFKRTRENMYEFGAAGAQGKSLRRAFNAQLIQSADRRVVSRLQQQMVSIAHTDITQPRGRRQASHGDLLQLVGFQFNARSSVDAVIAVPYSSAFTRTTGTATFDMDAFTPTQAIIAPRGTTHFKMVLAASAVDLLSKKNISVTDDSGDLPWNEETVPAINLSASVAPNALQPVFVVLSIEFLQQVNDVMYLLETGIYNPCGIINVDMPA